MCIYTYIDDIMKHFDILLHSGKTVFDYASLGLLLKTTDRDMLKSFIQRAVKNNLLQKVENGIYSLGNYDLYELTGSLRKKSYISLETVLQKEGIIFQDYSWIITLVSDNSLTKEVAGKRIQFSKIKESILLNPLGINSTGTYMIASPERAICDRIYLSGETFFDHLHSIDLKKLEEIGTIYPKSTRLVIKKLIAHAANT